MNRKEILKTVAEKFKEGQTRQQIFKELLPKVKFKSDLIQFIAMVPNHEDRIKYRNLNMLLFSLLVFISISKVIIAALILGQISLMAIPFALIVPFFSIYFAVMVWNFNGQMYRILGMLGIAGLLQSLSKVDQLFSYNLLGITIELLFYVPAILIIVLAYYIGNKAFPHYGLWGNLKEDKLNLKAEQKI